MFYHEKIIIISKDTDTDERRAKQLAGASPHNLLTYLLTDLLTVAEKHGGGTGSQESQGRRALPLRSAQEVHHRGGGYGGD